MNLHRRTLLRGLAAAGATAALPGRIQATSEPPWSAGFRGVTADLPPLAMSVQGQLPPACHGTLYRNGPARYARGGQRYAHWFDPDGMVQAYTLHDRGITHRGRFVRTEKFAREEQAGRFLYNGAGTLIDGALPVRSNETTNVANINVQPVGGELWALWEAGSPHRLDPDTLETRGRHRFSDALDGVPYSAHPHTDAAGEIWNIGAVPFADKPVLALYHLDRQGRLKKWHLQPLDFAGYIHDFVLTPRHLIVLNSSALLGEGDTFVDGMRWHGDRASQLLVFDRDDFALRATLDIPPMFAFHFGNGWERDGTLHFTACQYADARIVTDDMRRLAGRAPGARHATAKLVHYGVALRQRRVTIEALDIAMEFPGHDRLRPFERQPLLGVGGQDRSASGLATSVLRVDPESGAVERYDYGDGFIVEEPLCIGSGADAWVIHSFLDYRQGCSGLAVLSANRLGDGPVATARMERLLPLGFHGCFLPA